MIEIFLKSLSVSGYWKLLNFISGRIWVIKKIAGALGNRVLVVPCGIPMLTDTTKYFIITKVVKHLMVGDQIILATASALMYLTIQSVIMMVVIVVDLM